MRRQPHGSLSVAFLRGAVVVLLIPLAACNWGTPKAAATPPAPKPVAVAPPAPEPPLSAPQTAVVLPSPQPVNPDAIPAVTAVETPPPEKAEAPAPTRTAHRPPSTTPARQEPEPQPETPAAVPATAPAESARIAPILSDEDLRRIRTTVEERRHQIDEKINRPGRRSKHDQTLVERIKAFLTQCGEAEKRGDYTQADSLSQRAFILAQELP